MNEFFGFAESIAGILDEMSKEQEIPPDAIPKIISDATGIRNNFNCYPGVPGHQCYDLAFFVSLQAKHFRKRWPGGLRHLSCNEAMVKLVQHMQGFCYGQTTSAILIADNWDAKAFDGWKHVLFRISEQHNLLMCLITAGKVSSIRL